MKQIIPFKKELLFKTKVSEITSISLEHNLLPVGDDLVSGEFIITGDYKMTDASINREVFEFILPFDIALDSRYDSSSLVIDIDNFYYEVINNEFLQVNIDVYVEGEKLVEEENRMQEDNDVVDTSDDSDDDAPVITLVPPLNDDKGLIKPLVLPRDEDVDNRDNNNANYKKFLDDDVEEVKMVDDEFNISSYVDNSDTYVAYHVYIVKDGDTIDTIMERYKVGKESLSLYNDIENIKVGTKMIIPYES